MAETQNNDPLRITFVHHGSVLGGAPVSLLGLVRELQKLDNLELTVLCLNEQMQQFFEEEAGVQTRRFPEPLTTFGKVMTWGITPLEWRKARIFLSSLFRFPFNVYQQWRCLRQCETDVVHLNSAVLLSSAIAARLAGLPVVWHVREMLHGGKWNLRRLLFGWLIRAIAGKVVTISPDERRRLGGEQDPKVEVIYNPVDFEELDPLKHDRLEARRKLEIPPEAKVVLSLGGVSHWKGTVEMLNAVAETDESTLFVFAGNPMRGGAAPIPNKIKRQLKWEDWLIDRGWQHAPVVHYAERAREALAKAPEDRIRFIGMQRSVGELIAACDVLVFAGTWPHSPRPVYEAWAMERPVIVLAEDGISTKVEDGIDGIVVRERGGQALGEAIRRLLESPSEGAAMGRKGRAKMQELCRPEKGAARLSNIYRCLAAS